MKSIIAILVSTLILMSCAPNYSEGSRVGVVTKLSYKGLMMKSWEGELNQGGFKTVVNKDGDSSLVANVLAFNVQDPKIVEQIEIAKNTGKRVELKYTQWFLKPIDIENSYVITAVVFLDDK